MPTRDLPPQIPVLSATIDADGRGELAVGSDTESFAERSVDEARELVREKVAAYAQTHLHRPVRLRVTDPDGEWLIAVSPSGEVHALGAPSDTAAGEQSDPDDDEVLEAPAARPEIRVVASAEATPTNGAGAAPASEPPRPGRARGATPATVRPVDRRSLHGVRPGPVARAAKWVGLRLKSPDEHLEDAHDVRLAARHVVSKPNLIAVASPKGGPGKSTMTATVGDALARHMPNQRVLAVDFNPGGGVLGAIAPADRAARWTMLDLYEHRHEIQSHAQLQPYVSSLPSGLDILSVPPEPELAETITPEHYEALFELCLLPNYSVLLLDTKPDIIAPVTKLALQRAHQLVIVTEQDYLTGEVVERGLRYLLTSPAAGRNADRTVMVLNKVLDDPRAGRITEVRQFVSAQFSGPVIEVPNDLDLRGQLNAGDYTLAGVRRRATRVPLKQLAVHVAEHLV